MNYNSQPDPLDDRTDGPFGWSVHMTAEPLFAWPPGADPEATQPIPAVTADDVGPEEDYWIVVPVIEGTIRTDVLLRMPPDWMDKIPMVETVPIVGKPDQPSTHWITTESLDALGALGFPVTEDKA